MVDTVLLVFGMDLGVNMDMMLTSAALVSSMGMDLVAGSGVGMSMGTDMGSGMGKGITLGTNPSVPGFVIFTGTLLDTPSLVSGMGIGMDMTLKTSTLVFGIRQGHALGHVHRLRHRQEHGQKLWHGLDI